MSSQKSLQTQSNNTERFGDKRIMEPYFDDIEEDGEEEREYRARLERRRRMRRERQRRIRRRRMYRRLFCLGVIVVAAFFIGTAVIFGRKAKGNAIQPQAQKTDAAKGTGRKSWEKVAEGLKADTETGAGIEVGTAIGEGAAGTETDVSEPEKDPSVYHFAATPDTVTIYSEEVMSTNAILIEESTDTIIAAKGAEERISPASMTKVLTVLVAAEQLTEEDLDDTFTMTLEITDYAYVNDCSSVGFLNGEEVTVRDLFYGTVLPSGGDAAVGLATYVAGSHEAFVDMMNAKLEELGIADSAHFTNCVGLYDENHYCTVYDVAVIMKAAMRNELCREFLSAHIYTTVPTKQHPEGITMSNWFLRRIEDKDTGGEVLCAKTGYVTQAGSCAVSYGIFAGGTPYICVTANATSSWRCIYDQVEIFNRYIPSEE